MKIYSSEINEYARENRCSYQEAWRALVDESADKFGEKSAVTTKFAIKELVGIRGLKDEGSVADIIMNKVLSCPKYTVVLNGNGRVVTLDETELIKRG